MSRKIDKTQLEARSQDIELRIREAQWLENLRSKGSSPEDVEASAKEILGASENDSVIERAAEILPKMNVAKASVIQLNNLTTSLSSHNFLSQEEEVLLRSIEKRLGEKVGKFYGIEDIYEQEEN